MISKMRKYIQGALRSVRTLFLASKTSVLCPYTPVPTHCVPGPGEKYQAFSWNFVLLPLALSPWGQCPSIPPSPSVL